MYLAKCYGLPRAWPCRSKIGPWRPRQRRLLRLLGGVLQGIGGRTGSRFRLNLMSPS